MCLGWIVAGAINMLVLYGPYDMYRRGMHTVWSPDVNALYMATHRFAWSVGLAWLTFACSHGYGGRQSFRKHINTGGYLYVTCTHYYKILQL